MRYIDEIIVHCSDTRPNWMSGSTSQEKRDEIRRWHMEENGWSDIGYHFVIDRNGTVVKGRELDKIGAHVIGKNKTTIGICLIGGYGSTSDGRFSDNFTTQQEMALRATIADMSRIFGNLKVSGHNQYAKKACPGFNVPAWYKGNRTMAAELVNQPTAMPTRKVAAGGIAGILTTAAIALIDSYFPGIGTALSAPIAAGITVAVSFIAAYFTRNAAA